MTTNCNSGEIKEFETVLNNHGLNKKDFSIQLLPQNVNGIVYIVYDIFLIKRMSTNKEKKYDENKSDLLFWDEFDQDLRNGFFN